MGKCTHTYQASQVTANIFMVNFTLEFGSPLHLGNCRLAHKNEWKLLRWLSELCNAPVLRHRLNSSWGSHCKYLPSASPPEGSRLLRTHTRAPQALCGWGAHPLHSSGGCQVQLGFSQSLLVSAGCWNTSQNQITGLSGCGGWGISQTVIGRWGRYRLSDSDNWGDVNMNFCVYSSTPTLLTSSSLLPSVW